MTINQFSFGDITFSLPESWQLAQTGRDSLTTFESITTGSDAHFTVQTIDPQKAMPFGQDENVINIIHEQSIDNESGLIEVKSIAMEGFQHVYSMFKRKIPVTPPGGVMYSSSLYTKVDNLVFVFQFVGKEKGRTGMRDAVISTEFLQSGELGFIEDPETGKGYMQGWNRDPYDPNFVKGFLMNISEESKYDGQFPEHPLSIVRAAVKSIIDTTKKS